MSAVSRPPFEEVVNEHGPVVMRVCRALLPATDAEDAWSETFLAALRAYPQLDPESHVKGWLVTIAHRKAIDVLRARSRRAVPQADAGAHYPALDAHDPQNLTAQSEPELAAQLAALAPKQRAAVVYRYLADLDYQDVARLLDCSPAAARRNAADGIARLRATYRADEDHR